MRLRAATVWVAPGATQALLALPAPTGQQRRDQEVLTELLAMRYAEFDNDVANEGLMGTAYGITVTVTDVGMVLAGVGVARTRGWGGWRRWTPLIVGLAVFLVVTPGMFGGFVTARLAIGSWFLLFAALGWSLYTDQLRTSGSPTRRAGSPRASAAA